jgi:hypothetical protein
VFVAGNPGRTDRLLTAEELTTLRDARPPVLYDMSELRGRYTRFGAESAEHARIVNRDLFGTENALKALKGEQEALMDDSFLARKRKEDAELQARVKADPKLAVEIGDPWGEIAKAQAVQRELYVRDYMLEGRAGGGSRLFRYARTIVRGAEERAKPNGDRLREYADARLPLVEKTLLASEPVEPDLEQMKLEFWLSKLREQLTPDAAETKKVLGKQSPEDLAKALV